jgi:hypothetical protein
MILKLIHISADSQGMPGIFRTPSRVRKEPQQLDCETLTDESVAVDTSRYGPER